MRKKPLFVAVEVGPQGLFVHTVRSSLEGAKADIAARVAVFGWQEMGSEDDPERILLAKIAAADEGGSIFEIHRSELD